ncbi:MAG TPA: HWE histidine kinase domain-containing protein, partial [Rhodopila sp.]|nr:HWE histidine kinase domain-containing protein [Rhodopila sp.]
VVNTVSWGGDPTKQVAGRNGAPLPPRQSFEVWKQTVHGQSAAWNERDMDAAADLRIALLDVALRRMHAAAREQALVREHQQRLVVELDHWMSNTLEVVQTLVGHTSRSAPAVNGYLQGLERRISAMARSHGLLTQSQGDGMALLGLLRDELEPLCRGGAGCSLNGPDLIIVPTTALPLSLAFHELASNAARHGALSATTGQVTVSWELDRQGNVRLRWAERGGPPVQPPAQRGLGATLIERVLSSQLGSKAKLKFASEGVQCDITLPASAVVRVSAIAGAAAA